MAFSAQFKVALAFSVAVICTGPAMAQSVKERVNRLESAVQDLQGVVYSVEGGAYGSPTQAGYQGYVEGESYGDNMSTRIGQLERELQNLTGRIEQIAYQLEQNDRRINSLIAVINPMPSGGVAEPYVEGTDDPNGYSFNDQYSDQTGEPPAGTVTGRPTDLSTTGTITQSTQAQPVDNDGCLGELPSDSNGIYDYAFDALLNGDYQKSECAFQAFLDRYPDDPRAPDAQFRLGEIYLATGANLEAAKAFLNHVRSWPNDARAPESYLKLGTAYARLGKKAEACQIFDVANSRYPNASPSVRERIAVERGAAGC